MSLFICLIGGFLDKSIIFINFKLNVSTINTVIVIIVLFELFLGLIDLSLDLLDTKMLLRLRRRPSYAFFIFHNFNNYN